MSSELKPCPFCGGEGILYKDEVDCVWKAAAIKCKNCGSNTGVYFMNDPNGLSNPSYIRHAINAWNRRVKDEM